MFNQTGHFTVTRIDNSMSVTPVPKANEHITGQVQNLFHSQCNQLS